MRASIKEVEEISLARFLSVLNYAIRDKVELLPYSRLDDLVKMCIKVEQELLRKPSHNDSSI